MERRYYLLSHLCNLSKQKRAEKFPNSFFLIQIDSDSFFQELSRREQARALDL